MENEQHETCSSCSFGEILLIGEELRMRMHMSTQPVLIRDHRRLFQVHKNSFVVNQAVTWLVDCGNAPDRRTALRLLTVLKRNDIIHQVCDDRNRPLKDDGSFCRFRNDDGTYKWVQDVLIYRDAQNLYSKLCDSEKTCLHRKLNIGSRHYNDCFYGDDLVQWMTKFGGVPNRNTAISSCSLLLQNHLIAHVHDKENFKDEHIVYQFVVDMRRSLSLINLLIPTTRTTARSYANATSDAANLSNAKDIPRSNSRLDSGGNDQCNISGASLSSYSQSMSPEDSRHAYPHENDLLIRKATLAELTCPDSQFRKKTVKITSDEVGFGFVIRGDGPVFVKIMDPTGPAANAGLKVGHYLLKLNGRNVLNNNQKDLAHMILDSVHITLTVLEHVDAKKN